MGIGIDIRNFETCSGPGPIGESHKLSLLRPRSEPSWRVVWNEEWRRSVFPNAGETCSLRAIVYTKYGPHMLSCPQKPLIPGSLHHSHHTRCCNLNQFLALQASFNLKTKPQTSKHVESTPLNAALHQPDNSPLHPPLATKRRFRREQGAHLSLRRLHS